MDVYCTYCRLDYSHTGRQGPMYSVTLSPAILRRNGELIFEKKWRVTDINAPKVVPTPIKKEKELTRYFLTDRNNKRIEDYETGDTIVLNIETENRIGDTVDINLNDHEHDFNYKGSVLPNDTLKGIVVGSNLEQIPLEVIEQKTT